MTSTTSITPNSAACLDDMSAASLFVGELLPHVNEVILYKKFAPMGTVTSVKLCRDWVTGKSLCYAYVNFENAAEAEKAYRTLNYELLEGQPMRIMKSTRNPWLASREESTTTNCCYHHHHHHCCGSGKELIDPKTLVEAIETYSRVVKEAEENKAPTGYRYSKEFLKRMNVANKQFTNVFIKNFKDLLDNYKLYRLCKQFGEVTSAKVMLNEHGISKGFGFVCFRDSDAAQRAVNKLNGLVLDGRTLFAGPAMTRSQRQKENYCSRSDTEDTNISQDSYHHSFSPRICIRNLRDIVDKIRLQKEFERFGPVIKAELMKNNDERSRGTGYVLYHDAADAIKAVSSMNGKVIYGTRIMVAFAPHDDQRNTGSVPPTCDNDLDVPCNKQAVNHNTGDGDVVNSRSLLDLKDLANTLAQKGHPVNINDIALFNNNNTVNRNSSNNSDINTSNNAIKNVPSGQKDSVHNKDVRTKNHGDGSNNLTDDDINDEHSETPSATATLSVKNLDESITDDKLESLFALYGQVISAKVVSSEFGVSKGFGFVTMADMQEAVRAIKNLDGRIVVNRPVYIFLMTQSRSPGKLLTGQ